MTDEIRVRDTAADEVARWWNEDVSGWEPHPPVRQKPWKTRRVASARLTESMSDRYLAPPKPLGRKEGGRQGYVKVQTLVKDELRPRFTTVAAPFLVALVFALVWWVVTLVLR